MEVKGRRKRGSPKRKWLNRVRDGIGKKCLLGRKCTTMLHGRIHIDISTPT